MSYSCSRPLWLIASATSVRESSRRLNAITWEVAGRKKQVLQVHEFVFYLMLSLLICVHLRWYHSWHRQHRALYELWWINCFAANAGPFRYDRLAYGTNLGTDSFSRWVSMEPILAPATKKGKQEGWWKMKAKSLGAYRTNAGTDGKLSK